MPRTLLGGQGSRKPGWSADHKQQLPSWRWPEADSFCYPSFLSFPVCLRLPFLFSPTPGPSFIGYLGKKGLTNVQTRLKWYPVCPPATFFPERLGWVIYKFSWEHLDTPLVLFPLQKSSGQNSSGQKRLRPEVHRYKATVPRLLWYPPPLTALAYSTLLVPLGFLQAMKRKASTHQGLAQVPERLLEARFLRVSVGQWEVGQCGPFSHSWSLVILGSRPGRMESSPHSPHPRLAPSYPWALLDWQSSLPLSQLESP